ncbi:hypothetical protein RTM1035_07904 [Roseovarius sp. TM1035]|uniref:MGMT family protein n=1 Tax=Roseovarius sp. TM1035 TaxID=391613 RepID=UPI0001556D69|nr:MGMT family protein [Roseovarius sp. TM1035]EDM31840.1 hypothetical protein RTM1035_07904 [Roseovarius sp. TM1035]
MRRALLRYLGEIPVGSVVEVATLAEALKLPARHVAHILSRLGDDEAELLPWHRVIPRGGAFTKAQMGRPRTIRQIGLLQAEGVPFVDGDRLNMASVTCWQPPDTHLSTFWADLEDDEPA